MNNLYCIDPHSGIRRAERLRQDYWKQQTDRATCFMILGASMFLVGGYLGYLIGRA
jgi:hypothetical protein